MNVVVDRLRKSERIQAQLRKRYVNKKLEVTELKDKLKTALDTLKEEGTAHATEKEAWEAEKGKWAEEKRSWEANLTAQLEEARNKARQDALDGVAPIVDRLKKKVTDMEAALEVARVKAIQEYQKSAEASAWALDSMETLLEENYYEGYFRGQLRSRRIAHQLAPDADHAFLDCVECPRKEVFRNKHHPRPLVVAAFAIWGRYPDPSPLDPQTDYALALEDWNLEGLLPIPENLPPPGVGPVPDDDAPPSPDDAGDAGQEVGRVAAGVEPEGDVGPEADPAGAEVEPVGGGLGGEDVETRDDPPGPAEEIVDVEE